MLATITTVLQCTPPLAFVDPLFSFFCHEQNDSMSADQVTNTKQASVDIIDWHDLVRYVGREDELAATAAECLSFADDISVGEH